MAPLLNPMPGPAPSSSRCSPLGLALCLVFLITGVSMLLAGLLTPSSQMHTSTVAWTAASREANGRHDVDQVVSQAPEDPRLRFTTRTETNTKNRTERAMGHDQSHVTEPGPGIVRADLQQKARRPRGCSGAHAESAHLPTIPLCSDPRVALKMMAEAQYRGRGIRWNGTAASNAADGAGIGSDDRIANALFLPVSAGQVQ
jgi:hypothetical protein